MAYRIWPLKGTRVGAVNNFNAPGLPFFILKAKWSRTEPGAPTFPGISPGSDFIISRTIKLGRIKLKNPGIESKNYPEGISAARAENQSQQKISILKTSLELFRRLD